MTPLDAVADDEVAPLTVVKVNPVVEGRLMLTWSLATPFQKSNSLAPAATETGFATTIAVMPEEKLDMPAGSWRNCDPLKFTAGSPFTALLTNVG